MVKMKTSMLKVKLDFWWRFNAIYRRESPRREFTPVVVPGR